MKRYTTAVLAATFGLGLACSGGGSQTSAALDPAQAKPAQAKTSDKKLSKPLDAKQAAAAKEVAAAKAKNGKPSPDGTKKLQVERKKKKAPSGEIVWVIVEEWVAIDEWHDEIWVVDALVDDDDVLLVELDDFDAALLEEIVALELDAFEEVLAEEIVGAVIEQAVEEAVVEEVVEQVARELTEAEEQ